MHEKKQKGDIGLTFTIASLTEQEYNVSVPLTEHAKYDLVVEKNGVLKTVQVRYTTPKNGSLKVKLRSCWADRNGSHSVNRKNGDYDILAIYNPENKKVYFLNDADFKCTTGVALRLKEVSKYCKGRSRKADDYLICKT